MRFLPICILTSTVALGGMAAMASAAPDGAATHQDLGVLVVRATRIPQPILDTAASISVVTAKNIRNNLAGNIREMVRYLPNVSVPTDATRFGRQGFDIRGIGGNRVMILLDGVPVSDSFSIGNFSNAGRDFVDPSVLKRVEIIRGPASSLYGSGAVGGVVSFTTKDPGDYLAQTNQPVYFGAGLGYSSVDDGAMATITTAFGNDNAQGMIVYTRRQGHALSNQGTVDTLGANRTTPNPRDYHADNLLMKGKFAWDGATLRVTLGGHRNSADTNVYSDLTTTDYSASMRFPYIIRNIKVVGHDSEERDRASASLDFDGASWFDHGQAIVYGQYSNTNQHTVQRERKTIMTQVTDYLIHRRFEFSERVIGGSLTLRTALDNHLLVYGLDLRQSYLDEERLGAEINLQTGTTSHTVGPDHYPVRDFPLSVTNEAGVFVEDRISLLGGDVQLVPGLRYDYYHLDADNDPVFRQDNPGITPQNLTESSWSPRLGVVYKFTEHTSLFGQYAYGFRAPAYNAVNLGFTNLQFGYTAIPNPHLQPETSNAFELGIKHYGNAFHLTVSGYYDRFDHFIEPQVSLGVNPQTGLLTFQSRNLGEVTIYGIEVRSRWFLDFITPGLSFNAAFAWGVGNNEATDQPLASVAPPEAVLGLGYAAPSGIWNARLMGRFVRAKTRLASATQFSTPGYATFDVLGNIRLADNIELVAGLFNITDKKYWNWSSVQGQSIGSAVIDRYSAPGFHAGISLHMHW